MSPMDAVVAYIIEKYHDVAVPGVDRFRFLSSGCIDIGDTKFLFYDESIRVVHHKYYGEFEMEYCDPELFEKIDGFVARGLDCFRPLCHRNSMPREL